MHKILLVDDDSGCLKSTARLLHEHKDQWELILAQSADEAMDCLKKHDIDLIISDILMPGKSGMELLAQIKAIDALENIPVIMVSGQTDTESKINVLKMGASELLSKPFDKAELEVRIENCLRLKTYFCQISQQKKELEKEIADRNRFAQLVSETNAAIVEEDKLENLLQRCCQAIVDCLDAVFARIWVMDNKKDRLELIASAGMYTHIKGNHQFIPSGQYKIGRIAQDKTPHFTNAVISDPETSDPEWAEKENIVAFAGHPLIAKGRLAGVMAMFSKTELKESTSQALSSIGKGIALGILQKKSDDQVRFYSFYDSLTLLPNRKFFYVFLGKMINYADRNQSRFALIVIDIDDFNRINESLGHIIGDKCLKIVSERLLATLRECDCLTRLYSDDPPIARMGGDEFAVLLQDADNISNVSRVVQRLLTELSKSLWIEDRELILSASVGISMYPDNGNSIADLFKNADTALYHAKQKGKNNFTFYSKSMNVQSLQTLDLEINLRHALEKKEFCLYYQPKVELKTNAVIGAEALIRWQKENGDIVSPIQFIPLAEETGLILPIGDWVIEDACRQNLEWQKAGLKKIPLAINVSGKQFGQKNFVEKIIQQLKSSGLHPDFLEIEITETTIMTNPDTAIHNLKQLKNHGLKISLDDFGTGYSSLAYLQKLPIDQLKIDRSFIKNILSNSNDALMVKAIVSMAHNLDLEVIAEGVEDIQQLEFLAALDCDVIQGYLYSPPVSADKFSTFLNDSFKFDSIKSIVSLAADNDGPEDLKAPPTVSIQWRKSFCIGEKTIDEQHQKWFQILHKTQKKLLGNLKCTIGEIGPDALNEMIEYTKYHFSYEEAFLEKADYSGLTDHKAGHADLIKKLEQFNRNLNTGKTILTSEIIELMETWFIEHILIEDQKFKKCIESLV